MYIAEKWKDLYFGANENTTPTLWQLTLNILAHWGRESTFKHVLIASYHAAPLLYPERFSSLHRSEIKTYCLLKNKSYNSKTT